jgi:tripartite-type tricarboxylate transporter receptor subunit TctC
MTGAAGLACAGMVARATPAHAAWPGGSPIRIVVPASPGGPTDICARLLAEMFQKDLAGSRVVVENRAGGGGNIGMQAVIRAEPDGYTLHVASSIWAINPSLYTPPPHDPLNDLVPISEIATSATLFVVRADSPIRTMADAVAVAKRDQDKFNISIPPFGSVLHLAAELFKLRENIKRVAIMPFPGGGQAVQALLTDTVQMCSSSLAPAFSLIESGRLRAIAVLGEKRIAELPDVPTAIEQGYPDFVMDTYLSLMAPVKTPPAILETLQKAVARGGVDRDIRAKFANAGLTWEGKSGEQHMTRLRREVPLFKSIIDQAGIRIS